MSYISSDDWEKCTECGECLARCPVLNLDGAEASRQIGLLRKGEPAPLVFDSCALCFNCNVYCPEGLHPHELILERLSERDDHGKDLPAMVPYFFNGLPGKNLFQDLYLGLSKKERAIIERWSDPPSAKDVLFIGCVGKLFCEDLERSRVLESLPKFGPVDVCCGELPYRSGRWKEYARVAERAIARLSEVQAERIVCYCGSCNTFLGKIMPRVYGKSLPFKFVSLYEWLLERHEAGLIELKRPLHFKAAVHESCYATELGPEFASALRKIYRAAGMETVELERSGDLNTSCGAAGVARRWSVLDVTRAQNLKYAEVKRSGVSEMALNCPGCYLTMASTAWMKGVKLRYMPEHLLRAFGDDVKKPASKLVGPFAWTLLKNVPLAFKKASLDP